MWRRLIITVRIAARGLMSPALRFRLRPLVLGFIIASTLVVAVAVATRSRRHEAIQADKLDSIRSYDWSLIRCVWEILESFIHSAEDIPFWTRGLDFARNRQPTPCGFFATLLYGYQLLPKVASTVSVVAFLQIISALQQCNGTFAYPLRVAVCVTPSAFT